MTIPSRLRNTTARVSCTHPPSKCPFALMQPPQLLTAHMFPVTGVILVWPPPSEQYHCLRSTCLQILIWTTSPAVTKGTEKNTQRRVEPSNTPNGRKKKKFGEEFDGFLILVRYQTSSEREGAQLLQLKAPLAVRNLAVTCTLKTRPPLDFGWITDELFCYSDVSFQEKQSQFFDRPWQDDDYWIIHNVFLSPSQQMCFFSIFHEQTMLRIPQINPVNLGAGVKVLKIQASLYLTPRTMQ